MIIEIKGDIFTGNDFKGLNYLIQILTYKQRYELFVDLSIINDTTYYKRLDIDDKNEIESSFNKTILEGLDPNPKYLISENINMDYCFNVEEAIYFFNQPISIILENSLNDQYFLMAIIKYFDETGEVQRQLDNGWIQFENAGGCGNVENFIKGKLQSFNNLSYKYNKEGYMYLRCFVLLDSDKEYPNEPLKNEFQSLLIFLNNNHILSHFLEKRCMENYMPDDVFNKIVHTSEQQSWLATYLLLSVEQKSFLNISRGFSKKDGNGMSLKNRQNLKQEIQNFYSNISQVTYEILDKGFALAHFKNEFPKNFSDTLIDKTTLQNCCSSNELQDILDKIASFL
jgi:hypothetical protein